MNHYDTLGVNPQATTEDISKAYQTLTKKFRVFGEQPGSNKFKQLDKAYDVLSDANARKTYDALINKPGNVKKQVAQAKKARKKKGAYDNRNVVSILIMLSIILGFVLSFVFATFYLMLLPVLTAAIGIFSLWRAGEVTQDPVSLEDGIQEVGASIVEGIIEGLTD